MNLSGCKLALRVVAVCVCDDPDAEEFEAADGALAFDLIACETAQIINEQSVELATFGRVQSRDTAAASCLRR